MSPVKRNIYAFVGHRYFRNSVFHYVLLVPLYISSGLSVVDIALIEATYWTAKSASDIPTGYLADLFGPRISVIVGSCLVLVGFAMIATGQVWLEFAFGVAVLAVGHAFCSGADSAMIANALEREGAADAYPRAETLGWAARNLALAIACLLSYGLVQVISLRDIVLLSAAFTIPAILLPLLVSAGPRTIQEAGLRTRVVSLFQGLRLSAHRAAGPVAIFVFLLLVDFLGNWLFQFVMSVQGIEPRWFGAAYAVVLGVSTGALWLGRLLESRSFSASVTILLLLAVAYYLSMALGVSLDGVPGLVLIGFGLTCYGILRGLYFPIMRTEISRRSQAEVRSTVHSAATFLGGAVLAAINPLVGVAIELTSLPLVLFGLGLVTGLLLLVFLSRYYLIAVARALQQRDGQRRL
ncbi:hypothetical protein AY600_08755 [Phormidium willei BDU 130791]|nr:hypothetical protein AY600_08755 [Phormidium willei BDU 130791]